jgi:hypothetical protein
LARSKLLPTFSLPYPKSRVCQWELTAAHPAAEGHGDPAERILVVTPNEASNICSRRGCVMRSLQAEPKRGPAAVRLAFPLVLCFSRRSS